LNYSAKPLPTNWHELGNEYELSLFWASLAMILGNVLAPAVLRETKGIGLVGMGAERMGIAVAKKAGCLVREIRDGRALRQAAKAEQEHHWPLCAPVAIDATKGSKRQWYDYDREYPRNCATAMNEATAETKDNGFWNLVTGIEPIARAWNLDEWDLLKTVPRLVPLYLRDVCDRRLHVDDILEDLAGFVARQGGAVDAKKVKKVLWMADEIGRGRRRERPGRKAMATPK
jgi:hypothetical protein